MRGPEPRPCRVPCRGSLFGSLDPVAALGQVQRGGKVVKLGQRQGDPRGLVGFGVVLLDRHAVFKGRDDDIALQRQVAALVNQRDDGGIEFVLDREHGPRLAANPGREQLPSDPLAC